MPAPTLAHRILRKTLRWIAPSIPLDVYQRLLPRNPIGFFYHTVSDVPVPHVTHLYPFKSTVEFEQDLLYLKQHFTLLSYSDLLSPPHSPNPSAFLSFDDGFAECYTVARPLLLKHNLPCLFFITTDWIENQSMYYRGKMSLCIEKLSELDLTAQAEIFHHLIPISNLPSPISNLHTFRNWILSHQQSADPLLDQVCEILQIDISGYLRTRQPFLTRAQIRDMQADGFVFGAHTRRHPKLNTLPEKEQAAEIIESCRIVCEMTGQDQVPFAFPFSGSGVDRRFLARLRTDNPHIGLIFDTHKLRVAEPFILNRIWADKPVPGIPAGRNLAYWFHDAYKKELSTGPGDSSNHPQM